VARLARRNEIRVPGTLSTLFEHSFLVRVSVVHQEVPNREVSGYFSFTLSYPLHILHIAEIQATDFWSLDTRRGKRWRRRAFSLRHRDFRPATDASEFQCADAESIGFSLYTRVDFRLSVTCILIVDSLLSSAKVPWDLTAHGSWFLVSKVNFFYCLFERYCIYMYVWKSKLYIYDSHDFTRYFRIMAIYWKSGYFRGFYQAKEENLGILLPCLYIPSYAELNRITSV